MKRKGLSLLLVVTLILSLFMFCTTAFAASNAENGLSAELITDKTEYTAGEEVGITLKVKNASPYINNIWAKLVLPEVLKLKQGETDSGVFELEINGEEEFTYTADTPAPSTTATTTTTTTTVAATTGSTNPDGPSSTGDVSLYIFGALALFSIIGLVVVMGGFKAVLKSRWFVLVLCLAMLVSVAAPLAASAAVTQKFFEVTATVKVDGVDTEIKAVITYDFDDGIYPAAEVVFKEDGESLYNLVGEMGWFTPCNKNIVVNGVAASNTSRPEVEASYISMLFGCVNTKSETGAWVPGILDNSQIISEDAELELLVGRTDDKASTKALGLIGQDEWIIAEIDGKIVVTGWYDNATVAAVQHLYNLVKDQDDVTLQLPIKGNVDGYIADIPDLEDGVFYGGMDSSEGAVVLRYGVETADVFEAYADKLLDEGYTLYAINKITAYADEKHAFATFVKGDTVVHVSYLSDAFMEADYDSLTANEKAYYDRSFRPIGKEIRVVIDSKDALFTNAANNDYTDLGIKPKVSVVNLYNKVADGNNNAECLIYTLADGSFIIVDGGFAQDADQVFKALTELNERPDGKIVIAAWIMSHHHGDHVGAFKAMADKEYAKEIYVEQFIYNPTAETYNWRSKNAPFNYSMDFNYAQYNNEYIGGLLAKFGDGDTQIVNPHLGQRMHIRNAEVEFIYTGDEDLYPIHIDNTNDSSMVFSVNFKGKDGEADSTMMVLNDSCVDSQYGFIMPLFSQAMDCDIVQVAHHGLGGPSTALYRMMEPIVAIWCSTESTAIKNNWFVEKDGGGAVGGTGGYLLWRTADDTNKPIALRMLAEHHVQTLELPYAAGDPVIKRNLGTYKSNFFELNKAKLVTVGAGQFGGNLSSCLADVAEYLLAENADVLGITEITADQVDTLVKALGYPYYSFAPEDADAENSIGNLLLSRYPILDEKLYEVEGNGVGVVVLDVEGIRVDVAYMDIDSADALDEVPAPSQGDYQVIMGVLNAPSNSQYAAVQNNLRENIYVTTKLASGAPLSGGKLEDAAEATGCEAMDKLVSVTVTLSRKHLIEDFEEGSFDDIPTVAVWWANYMKDLNNKEQVLTWLLKNKAEIVGLDHMPLELLSDEGAAEFAQLAGYEYFAWTRKHTVNDTTAYGQLLLSHYPIEDVGTVILRDIGAEGGEGRRYLRATVTMPGGEKVDVYVGDTDGGATKAEQLATLEAAVKARSEANNGRDFFILSCDAAIPAEFAGKTMKVYNGDGSYIAISGNYPMDGMRTYGTKAYPHEGRSPIGTTLPNIDKYSKVELANMPKYELTVNGGTGSGEFLEEEEVYAMAATPGKGMAFTGWIAEGITLEDPMAMEQIFEMPDNAVKLTATYKAVAYTERLETGSNSNELKVAVLPVYRFQTKFAVLKDQIVQNIRDINADLIAITIVDYDSSCKYNSVNVVPELKEALADVYAHSYFAPATKVGTTSDTDPGAGYVGHLLLSKYPILSSETIELNTETSEVRAVGHSIINVGTEAEPTRLGVYYSHLGAGSNWTSGKQNLYDVVANADEDAYVMIGKLHYTDNKATIAQKLGDTVAAKDANLTIFGSGNITVKADSYGEDTTIQNAVSAIATNTTEKLYYATISMPLYEDGETRYPVTINTDDETAVDGWYEEGATVTIVAPDAPAGYKFDGWTLPTGLTLTEGTAADATIKFTMPAAALELSMTYVENPTGTVKFDVNGGYGTIDNVTANVGNYTLPATADILSPAGKIFAGWALSADADKDDVINTVEVKKNETATVYAVWEETGSVSLMQWWVNINSSSDVDVAKIKAEVIKRNADIVGLVSFNIKTKTEAEMTAYAQSMGYPYAYYAEGTTGRGNVLLSKYPFTFVKNHVDASGYKLNHFEVTIGSEKLNVYTGYDCVPDNFSAMVAADVAATGNDFVLLSHRAGRLVGVANYAGLPITAGRDGDNGIAVSLNKWAVTTAPALTATGATFSGAGVETDVMLASIHLKAHEITFNANGGSGNQAPIYTDGGNVTLPTTTTFTAPAGSVFAGWSETAGGAAISGNSINVTGDKTLYAVWESTFTATVTGGTGSGTYTVGDAVTLTANAAPEGKVFSYWEGLGGLTLTQGNAVSSTIKFNMPGNNVSVQAVYRNVGEIKVGAVPTTRFQSKYTKQKDLIHTYLQGLDLDVMVITNLDQNAVKNATSLQYNKTGVASSLMDALKHEYPYQYFVQGWDTAGNNAAMEGWVGHLILSKFDFVSKNTIVQVQGKAWTDANGAVEGRGAGVVTINVDGVNLDIIAMNNGGAAHWDSVAGTGKSVAATINSTESNAWIAMGNIHVNDQTKFNTVNGYLTNGMASADVDSGWTEYIVGSTNLSWSNKSDLTLTEQKDYGFDFYANEQYPVNSYNWQFATVTLPKKQATVTFDANGGTGTQTDVTVDIGTSYTLPTSTTMTAPTGKAFAGWATTANGKPVETVEVTGNQTLYALWKPEQLTLKVAALPTNKFLNGAAYSNEVRRAEIITYIKELDADVVVLTLIDENCKNASGNLQWNKMGVYSDLVNNLSGTYPHSEFAKVWYTNQDPSGADANSNSGWLGHVIFSKHEIIAFTTIDQTEAVNGATMTNAIEHRGAGYATIWVQNTEVDVFFMANGSSANEKGNWTSNGNALANAVKASDADAWIAMGRTDGTASNLTTIAGYLGTGVTINAAAPEGDSNRYILGSENTAFTNATTMTKATWNYYSWQTATATITTK